MKKTEIFIIAHLIPLLFIASTAFGGIRQDLLKAVNKGDAAAVHALLEGGADVNTNYKRWGPVLSIAIKTGNTDMDKLRSPSFKNRPAISESELETEDQDP